ncbi:CHASE2 domain-containing protein [Stenotrophomonas mori]|uniref:diguanylate cyclase n=1 Tax=Stenotrophomonas mori TaxID=2871096 RepID=A0ABT0SDV5_9GAMM|nr:CHASE2 domain-containing protein [Stenotrophomonas mori]MCL7713501.1 CHASE2 domain-containing protein [Stenotrophomonas mori]
MNALRLSWGQRLLLALGIGLLAGLGSQARMFWQADEAVYDRLVGNWDYPLDPRLIIVAIDERSLQQLGQWPWPRSTHAQLLERLREAGVDRVALDLMLPEPDRKDATQDQLLAAAITRSGNVVLPVLAASTGNDEVPEELLPIPLLADAAAALAHTDIEVDADGVARGLYLKAGMGTPYWPALGLALSGERGAVPGLGDGAAGHASPYQWQRDNYVRLRYAGRPGSFPQVSYIDVIEGRVPPALLRGRLAIVGMTASGIAPRLLTPTSRDSWMSGSEYQANVASMLLGGHAILPLPRLLQSTAVALLVALCALGMTLSVSPPWVSAAVALPLPLLASLVLLRGFDLWFAPVAALAGILVVVLVCGLRQMRYWRRQANRDPLTGLANRMRFEEAFRLEYYAARRSGRPLSLALIDLDNFKHYNDTFGHHVGDIVLQHAACMVAELARRPRDLAARFGGDEFALVLPGASSEGARQLIEALVVRVRQSGVAVGKGQQARISITVGLATLTPESTGTPADLFRAADAALLQAKAAGRDGYRVAADA